MQNILQTKEVPKRSRWGRGGPSNHGNHAVNLPVRLLVWLLALVLIAPIVIVVLLSFSGDSYLTFPPTRWSVRWYAGFLGDAGWRQSMLSSVLIGLMTCLIATAIGFLGAYALVRGKSRYKKLLLSFVLLPLIVPTIITSIALYFLSVAFHLVGSAVWISVCHSVIAMPIVVLILLSSLQNVDVNLERAAFGLGASRMTTFRRVVIPLALPGVVSAALFSFLTSFDELIIALFLSGVTSQTLPVRIWNSLQMSVDPMIAAVSSFLIALTIAVLLLELAFRRWRKAPGTV